MLALVKAQPGPGLELMDRPRPSITSDDQVLIEVAGCGLCGSDLHLYEGRVAADVPLPLTIGHETAGTVVEVGAAVRDFAPGDRVIAESSDYCGRCRYCRRGEFGFCKQHVWMGFRQDGGLASHLVAPRLCLYKIPPELAFDEAIMIKTVGVPLHAIERVSIKPGDSVCVMGPGSIGLLAAMLADLNGATRVIVTGLERDAQRLEYARGRGYQTVVIDREDAQQRIAELTDGYGVDVVLEASGGRGALRLAVEIVRLGGQIGLIGIAREEPFNSARLVSKNVALFGSATRTLATWERAMSLVATRKLDVRPLITHRVPLSHALEAIELLKHGQCIKAIVTPS
jgi:L-iditol 2-dehydrogenase